MERDRNDLAIANHSEVEGGSVAMGLESLSDALSRTTVAATTRKRGQRGG